MTAVNMFMQLTQDLSHDFIREGWLYKTGPDPDSKYKKRWMSLDRRQLFYSAQPLVNVAVETYPSCIVATVGHASYLRQKSEKNSLYFAHLCRRRRVCIAPNLAQRFVSST